MMKLFENTDLGKLEYYANSTSNGAIRYLFANINAAALSKVIKSRKADKGDMKVGIFYQTKTPSGDFDTNKKALSYKDLSALYSNCQEFTEQFPSFEVFVQTLYKLVVDNAKTKTEIKVINNNNNSIANQVISEGKTEGAIPQLPNYIKIPLNTNFSAICYQTTEPDKWFFDRMCIDESGQLYWRFKTPIADCGCVYPISIRVD